MTHALRTILQNVEPLIAFSSVILVEPMLSPNGAPPIADLRKSLIKGACERKDVWPSKSHALKDLTAKAHKAPWNRRALELYVEHGLMAHKGAKWEPPYMGVTLACTRDEEAVRGIRAPYSASFHQHFLESGNVQGCPVRINGIIQIKFIGSPFCLPAGGAQNQSWIWIARVPLNLCTSS